MGEGRDGPGRVADGPVVAEVGQGDGGGAHQASVAGRVARSVLEVVGGSASQIGAVAARGQHGPGLHADISRAGPVPVQEPLCHRGGIQGTCGGFLGDAQRHLGVVGPFPGIPVAQTAAGGRRGAGRLSEERCPAELGLELVAVDAGQRRDRLEGMDDRTLHSRPVIDLGGHDDAPFRPSGPGHTDLVVDLVDRVEQRRGLVDPAEHRREHGHVARVGYNPDEDHGVPVPDRGVAVFIIEDLVDLEVATQRGVDLLGQRRRHRRPGRPVDAQAR